MKILCKKCNSDKVVKAGFKKIKDSKIQKYKCKECPCIFTGQERYSRLLEHQQIEILNQFREGTTLNQIAKNFNVRLYTVQYIINKVRKKNPKNEEFYQERIKNRKRTKQEIYMINKNIASKRIPTFTEKMIIQPNKLHDIPSYHNSIPVGMPQNLNNSTINKNNESKEYTTEEIINFDFG